MNSEPRNKTTQGSILLVDDEQNILHAIKRLLRKENYELHTAVSGEEALAFLGNNQVDVIISDHRMTGISGIELLERAKEICPLSVRIILSGYADFNTITDAINRGYIYKFILKPWNDEEFKTAIREALNLARLQFENYRLTQELTTQNEKLKWLNDNLEDEVSKRTQEVQIRSTILERFHYIIHQMPIGFIGLGDDRKIVFANNWAQVHIGGLKNLMDQDIETVLNSETISRLDDLIKGHKPLSMRLTIPGMDGPVEMKGAVIRYPDGVCGYVLIFIDWFDC